MADWRPIVVTTLRILSWPISKLLHAAAFLLSPIWRVTSFVALPFILLAHTIINIITFPFSVQWLERIETLYVYLGTAGLIGCVTGGLLFIVSKLISSSLNLDSTMVPPKRDQGRTTAQYRSARRETKEESFTSSPSATPIVLRKVNGSRRRGLLSQAIIEEEDSDL